MVELEANCIILVITLTNFIGVKHAHLAEQSKNQLFKSNLNPFYTYQQPNLQRYSVLTHIIFIFQRLIIYNPMQDNVIHFSKGTKNEKIMSQEENLRETLSSQYYNYITVLKQTNNFQKTQEIYANFDVESFNGNIAVIGSLSEISIQKNNEEYIYPIIVTTVNQNVFQKSENIYSQKKSKPIKRKLIISFNIYKKKLIIPLNKIMNICNKEKELFIFTHLKLLFHEEKTLYFGFTNISYMIQLNSEYYKTIFRPMEISLEYNYSELNLNNVFMENDFPRGTKFSIEEIKNKVHDNLNDMVIMGVLKKIHWDTFQKNVNPKEGEVTIQVLQDLYSYKYSSVGICKIYVRFQILEREQIRAHMQQGSTYTFSIKDAIIGQNLSISYKLVYWKQKFIKVSSNLQRFLTLQDLFNRMTVLPLNVLTYPCIFRNYYKFNVVKYQLKFLHAQSFCQKCSANIYITFDDEFFCRRQCGKVDGKLKLWAQVIVKDDTFTAQLSLQNDKVIQFFDLHEQSYRLKQEVVRSQMEEGKSGISVYFKKMKEDPAFSDFNDGFTYDKNQYIAKIVQRLLIVFVEKKVIAIPRANYNQNYQNFDEDLKNEVQTTFARSKEYFKKIKVFINGYTRNNDDQTHQIPFLKVQHVLTESTALK